MAISAFGVLVICFLANASVLLPSSSILIVVEYSMLINPLLVAFCGAFGAALGEMTGFYVGRYGRKAVPSKFMKWVKARMESAGEDIDAALDGLDAFADKLAATVSEKIRAYRNKGEKK